MNRTEVIDFPVSLLFFYYELLTKHLKTVLCLQVFTLQIEGEDFLANELAATPS